MQFHGKGGGGYTESKRESFSYCLLPKLRLLSQGQGILRLLVLHPVVLSMSPDYELNFERNPATKQGT